MQLRAVDLGDGGRGQWLRVKAGKNGLGLTSQVFDQLRTQRCQGHGGYVAVQLFELGDPFRPEQVGTTGQHLPQLDKGRPQFLERQANLHRGLQPGEVSGVFPMQGMAGFFQAVCQAQASHAVTKPVANEHPQDGVETPHVAGGAQGFDQHGRIIVPARAGRPCSVHRQQLGGLGQEGCWHRRDLS